MSSKLYPQRKIVRIHHAGRAAGDEPLPYVYWRYYVGCNCLRVGMRRAEDRLTVGERGSYRWATRGWPRRRH